MAWGRCVLFFPSWSLSNTSTFGLAYIRLYERIKKLIEDLNPDVVVVDFLMNPGLDACYSLNREFVVSSPNTPIDIARKDQPWLQGFWYYPQFVLFSDLITILPLT